MKILGPESYKLKCDPTGFVATCARGTNKFSGIATKGMQKIYIVSDNDEILYVGATTQSMSLRLRQGWKAKGESGYYGYHWRRENRDVELSIWLLESDDPAQAKIDIETIEAEIVYLTRLGGQWPRYQNEIHFHVSSPSHRTAAETIYSRYKS